MQERQTKRNWEKEGWGHEDLGTRHRGNWELIICAEKKVSPCDKVQIRNNGLIHNLRAGQ